MPDIPRLESEAELFALLCGVEDDTETFADYRSVSMTFARPDIQGHVIVGTGKLSDGGGVLPISFTLRGLINAVRDLTYLTELTNTAEASP